MFNVFGFDKIQLSGLYDIYQKSLWMYTHTDQQKIADFIYLFPPLEVGLRSSSSEESLMQEELIVDESLGQISD